MLPVTENFATEPLNPIIKARLSARFSHQNPNQKDFGMFLKAIIVT